MLRKIGALFTLVALTSTSAPASANTEPTAYDTRSIAMGLTGTSYLDRPAALALNPALMKGVERFAFQVMVNPIFVNTQTPVSGPGTEVATGVSLGPLGSIFLAGRIAPRVVFGAGFYIEQGYGATFDQVINVDGAAGNTEGEDLSVQQFNAEVAIGTSIEVHEKVSIGIALRFPFAVQKADLYQNIGAALPTPTSLYARVKNDLAGVGFPSPRIGIHYKPNKWVEVGAMWRAYSRVKMSGTTETALLGDDPVAATADWVVPNALQFGAATHLVDEKLTIVAELRLQFHDAEKQGNQDQTVVVDSPLADPAIAPFNWRNIWSLKLGLEYKVSKLIAVRAGGNAAVSNIREGYAQYFTPPPGASPAVMAGLGFTWKKFAVDLGTLISWAKTEIDPSVSAPGQTIPVGNAEIQVCSEQQVVRTGCAGTYKTNSYWLSVQFLFKL